MEKNEDKKLLKYEIIERCKKLELFELFLLREWITNTLELTIKNAKEDDHEK